MASKITARFLGGFAYSSPRLIDRAADPGDRRAVRVCMTEHGALVADRGLERSDQDDNSP